MGRIGRSVRAWQSPVREDFGVVLVRLARGLELVPALGREEVQRIGVIERAEATQQPATTEAEAMVILRFCRWWVAQGAAAILTPTLRPPAGPAGVGRS